MKATPVTPNIIRLERLHFVNAYLVREADGFTLVDTTLAGQHAAVLAAAREAGGEICRIALTHGHADHAGAVDGLRRELGDDVEILLGELDARILAGDDVGLGKLRGSWPKLTTAIDTRLAGGERIGSLEVVANPGHSPGHVAFLDHRDRTLLGGDTFTTFWRAEVPNRLAQPFPLATMGTQDRGGVVAAARALRELDPAILAVGHGPALAAPAAAMDAAIGRAEGRG